jgi:hypothetical protein
MAETNSAIRVYRVLAILAVIHSAAVFSVWLFARPDVFPLPPLVWVISAWCGLIWPLLLSLHRGRSLLRFAVPVLLGLALLIPCVPLLLAFTAWSIGGFAP